MIGDQTSTDYRELNIDELYKKFVPRQKLCYFNVDNCCLYGRNFDKIQFFQDLSKTQSKHVTVSFDFWLEKLSKNSSLFLFNQNPLSKSFNQLLEFLISPAHLFLANRKNSSLRVIQDIQKNSIDSYDFIKQAEVIGMRKFMDDDMSQSIITECLLKKGNCLFPNLFGGSCTKSIHTTPPFFKNIPRFPGDSNGGVLTNSNFSQYLITNGTVSLVESGGIVVSDLFLWNTEFIDQKTVDIVEVCKNFRPNNASLSERLVTFPKNLPTNLIVPSNSGMFPSNHSGSSITIGCLCGQSLINHGPFFDVHYLLSQVYDGGSIQLKYLKNYRRRGRDFKKSKDISEKCSNCSVSTSKRLWIQFHLISPSLGVEPTPMPDVLGTITLSNELNPQFDDVFPSTNATTLAFAEVTVQNCTSSMGLAVEYECLSGFYKSSSATCQGCRFFLDHNILNKLNISVSSNPSELFAFLLNNELPLVLPCPKCNVVAAHLTRVHIKTPGNSIKTVFRPILNTRFYADDAKLSTHQSMILPPDCLVSVKFPVVFLESKGELNQF
ncbi:hypothetical protein GEMRC1_002534 [Eukaryota sp. GEM-RC1]